VVQMAGGPPLPMLGCSNTYSAPPVSFVDTLQESGIRPQILRSSFLKRSLPAETWIPFCNASASMSGLLSTGGATLTTASRCDLTPPNYT
jgi:hypothetical protein